ncbi:MAG: hypothetical protein GQ474_03860, partial [Sulfurimonas sp.]|nr:hypothetical protein [Sulfurimonas sp.]
ISFTACGGATTNSKSKPVVKEKKKPVKKPVKKKVSKTGYEKYKKADNIYAISAKDFLKILNYKEPKSMDLQVSLEMLGVLKKNSEGKLLFNKLTETKLINASVDDVDIHGLNNVAYTKDNKIAVTGSMDSRASFVFYFSREYELQKAIIIKHPKDKAKKFYTWRAFLSDDAKYLYVHELLKIIDLNSFKTVSKIGKKDVKINSGNSDIVVKLYDAKFSHNNKYITFKTNTFGALEGKYTNFNSEKNVDIKTKKSSSGARFDTFFSDDEKYKVVFDTSTYDSTGYQYNDISLHLGNKTDTEYVFFKNYKNLLSYDVSWNKNRVFLYYSYADASAKGHWNKGGIFDVKTSKLICKDSFEIDGDPVDIGWINDKTLYILGKYYINYFSIHDEECLSVGSDLHGIKKFDKANKIHLENGILTVYPDRKSSNIEIKDIKLREIDKDTIEIYSSFKKINKMLKAGFEKRALKSINKLIDTQSLNLNAYNRFNIKAQKNQPAYISYFSSSLLNKKITNSQEFDKDMYELFRTYVIYAYWNGYYQQAKESTKHMKDKLKLQKNMSKELKKEFEDLISLSEAVYLICIGKDEGFDMLFDMQPISKKTKHDINLITIVKTPFSEDTDKLIAALDIKKEDLGSNDNDYKKTDFFFDMNGNKVTSGKVNNKVQPKKKVSKKSEAIELLD